MKYNGKVYKLQHDDGHFYFGSTTQELEKRFYQHRHCKHRTRLYKYVAGEWHKVQMLLIEEVSFDCILLGLLRQREELYIQKELNNPLCLNTNHSGYYERPPLDYTGFHPSPHYLRISAERVARLEKIAAEEKAELKRRRELAKE
jgi:hypothetical protein